MGGHGEDPLVRFRVVLRPPGCIDPVAVTTETGTKGLAGVVLGSEIGDHPDRTPPPAILADPSGVDATHLLQVALTLVIGDEFQAVGLVPDELHLPV